MSHLSGAVLGSEDMAENKTDTNPCHHGVDILVWGWCDGGDALKALAQKSPFFFFDLQGTKTKVLFPCHLGSLKCVGQVVNELLTNH